MAKKTELVRAAALAPAIAGETMTIGAFTFTTTAMRVDGGPSYDEWAQIGQFIRLVNSGAQWWWGDWLLHGEGAYPERHTQALEATGWEPATLKQYAHTAKHVPEHNRLYGVPFGHYLNGIAAEPLGEQVRWARRVLTEHWSQADLRSAIRAAKRQPALGVVEAGNGKARVLLADPPWSYDDHGVITESDAYGRAERHYQTLSVEAIMEYTLADGREVAALADDNSVLFLWCPAPLLLEKPGPREVIEAWGFVPKAGIVWDKVDHNYGHYLSVRHEHLLLATRGSCVPDRLTPMVDSVQTYRRSDVHSAKPEEFRQLIERLYDGPYRELFGRTAVDGWDVIGDQVSL